MGTRDPHPAVVDGWTDESWELLRDYVDEFNLEWDAKDNSPWPNQSLGPASASLFRSSRLLKLQQDVIACSLRLRDMHEMGNAKMFYRYILQRNLNDARDKYKCHEFSLDFTGSCGHLQACIHPMYLCACIPIYLCTYI